MTLAAKLIFTAVVVLVIALLVAIWVRGWARPAGHGGPPASARSPGSPRVAFVLLEEARLPTAEAVREALDRREVAVSAVQGSDDKETVTVTLANGAEVIGMLMPGPVPNGEADEAFARSFSSLDPDATLAPHRQHALLTLIGGPADRPAEQLRAFTQVVAAIVEAGEAVGVYWGAAGATHPAPFFLAMVEDDPLALPVLVGIDVVPDGDDRVSILGTGMEQFGLTDLRLTCSREMFGDGLAYYFDLLSYAVGRGAVPAEGDSVGRTVDEDARVQYAPSPVDPNRTVWCVDLP